MLPFPSWNCCIHCHRNLEILRRAEWCIVTFVSKYWILFSLFCFRDYVLNEQHEGDFKKYLYLFLTTCLIFYIYTQVDGIIFGTIFFVLFFCLQLELRHCLFCFPSFLGYYLDKHKQQGLLYGTIDLFSVTAHSRQQRKSLNFPIFCTVLNYSRIQTKSV